MEMKKAIAIINLGLIIFTSKSYALNFAPISEYAKNNHDIVSRIYVLERCSALFTYVGVKLKREKSKKSEIYFAESNKLANYAVTIYQKHHGTSTKKSVNKVMDNIEWLVPLYEQDSKEMFIKNGHYFSGIIDSDLNFCMAMASGL